MFQFVTFLLDARPWVCVSLARDPLSPGKLLTCFSNQVISHYPTTTKSLNVNVINICYIQMFCRIFYWFFKQKPKLSTKIDQLITMIWLFILNSNLILLLVICGLAFQRHARGGIPDQENHCSVFQLLTQYLSADGSQYTLSAGELSSFDCP